MNPICAYCNIKLIETEEKGLWQCDNCSRQYNENFEIMKYEDDFVSSHSDEMPELGGVSTAGAGLMAADDEQDPSLLDQLHKSARTKPNEGQGAETWD